MHRFPVCVAFVLAGCLSSSAVAQAQPAQATRDAASVLVSRTDATGQPAKAFIPVDEPTILRRRPVQVDTAQLTKFRTGDRLKLTLFDDVALEVAITGYRQSTVHTQHWQGLIAGQTHSSAFLVLHKGVLWADIRIGGTRTYRIGTTAGLGQVVDEINDWNFPPCGTTEAHAVGRPPVPPPPAPAAARGEVQAGAALPSTQPASSTDYPGGGGIAGEGPSEDCGPVVDVLIVYTPQARDAVGSVAGIEALALLAIDTTNGAYVNSLILQRARLVHVAETNYVESGNFTTEIGRLKGTNDGYMDEVHALRASVGADLVSLLISHTQGGTICGVGYLMTDIDPSFAEWGFNVNNTDCTASGFVLAHELGHNMGCHHDHANSGGPGAFTYSHGHRFTGVDAIQYRTVMAYAPGQRIQYFSNPNVLYQETPTGVAPGEPGEADNTATINDTAGTVSAFRPTAIIGDPVTWSPAALLTASGLAEGDRFGVSVAVHGELAIIGAYGDDERGLDAGAAYIYRADTAGNWIHEAKLTADDGAPNDRFGVAVDVLDSIDGEVAIVGAYLDDDGGADSGAAYVFRKGPDGWEQETKLVADDDANGDLFGRSVAIAAASAGEVAIVGSYLDDDGGTSTGSAYIFRNGTGGWNQEQKIKATDAEANDQFGFAVDIAVSPVDGSQLAVATAWKDDDDDDGTDAGSAYIFRKNASAWSQLTKLTAGDADAGDQLGFSVALTITAAHKLALVGAWKADGVELNAGAAYVFIDNGAGWNEEDKLTAPDGAPDDHFGVAVALSADSAIVGAYLKDGATADQGSAYVFQRTGLGWAFADQLTATDGADGDQLGFALGVHNGRAVVGAWQDDDAGADSGGAYSSAGGAFTDCNTNGIPDSCDISSGSSLDTNGDGVPDECDPSTSTCAGDMAPEPNGDGVVDVNDLLMLIGAWGPVAAGHPADLAPAGPPAGDGVVDVNDLLALIGAWGACP